ncbi:Signal transduction histidine kinase [Nannocystis exedens]|uniref:histidine kinase n=1 Tax=Nannocystis exedens TaxID=54 RepID=A0A1I1V412_9BACT|nr:ATP-binding protein [Nannocystis exedens]PCC72333.1 histidine kinase [Nannocystis exedens]SFD77772.1 Signal transduction histidine kinase [Nannocystis exedens]
MTEAPSSRRWLSWVEGLVPAQLRRDPVTRRRSLLALGILGANLLVGSALLIPLAMIREHDLRAIAIVNTCVCLLLMLLGVLFLRRGSLWLTGNWICAILYAGFVFATWTGGGVRAPFTICLALLPMLAGIIAGRRSGLAWGCISVATLAAVYVAQASGVELPDLDDAETTVLLAFGALAGTTILVTWMTSFSEATKEAAIVQIEQASAQLAAAIQEEEKARHAADQAIAANAAKSAFLATMSHELRTPLNAILGYSELVVDELRDRGGNEDLIDDIRKVHASGRHLLGLITDVLDLTRIEASRLELSPIDFEPAKLLREVAEIFIPLALRNNDVLTLDLADDTGPVHHDATRVRQVVINLVGNAIKFTRDGTVTVRLRGDPDTFEVFVEDTGIGIPIDKIERIFEPFTQVDASSTRRYEGTGLGLAVCRRLVSLMGGAIEVRSSVGRGSAFTVRLPRRYTIPERTVSVTTSAF